MSGEVTRSSVAGWDAVTLTNGLLRVTVLPGKGAELAELTDLESGIDLLFKGPWGLNPPGAPRAENTGDDDPFMWNYAGGWQELLPSVNDACDYRGERIPFHGEVATLPWEHEVLADGAVRLWTRCRLTPFRVERTLRLADGRPELALEGTVSNESDRSAHFVWGHHCVVGPPFLEPGCVLETSARTIVSAPQVWEETARLAPGQTEPWPFARLRSGGTVDLREVPGTEAGSHDDVYLGGLRAGSASVTNPRLGLTFSLSWDPEVFRWIVAWMPYGGALEPPLTGSYALGVEPWTSRHCLERAVEDGSALALAGGASLSTTVRARIERRIIGVR